MNSMVARFLFLFFLVCCMGCRQVSAAELVLEDDKPLRNMYLMPYIDKFTGESPPRTMQDARQRADGYAPLDHTSPVSPGETGWFRFSVRNTGMQPRSLVLDFDQSLYSHLEWDARSKSTARYILTGQSYPYGTRDIDYGFFAFRMDVPAGETLTVNFSISTPYASLLIPQLSEADRFVSRVMRANRISGSVIGMLLSMCVFLSVYVLRMRQFGLAHMMLAFSLMCFVSVLYIEGAIQRAIPDSHLQWRDISYVLIHSLQGFFFSALVRRFYQADRNYPFFDKCFLVLMCCEVLWIVLLSFVQTHHLIAPVLFANSIAMLLSLLLAILAMLQKRAGTYLFSAGLVIFNLMTFFSGLGSFGLVPLSLFTRYGYELALTIQVDFLAMAVASAIFSAGREKSAMEKQMIKLNADMQARSEFVDRVTHDIKSPLSAVMGAEQLLRNSSKHEEKVHYLDIIRSASGTVMNIVDDILHHSRVGQGELVLRNDAFDLQQLLDEIQASFGATRSGSSVSFSVETDESLPSVITGDRQRLLQVLTNLLNNAFKFTDEGRVELLVEIVEKKADAVRIRFIVQDTGIGMSAAFLDQAFNSYSREEVQGDYRPGFGLGLSICKQLVGLMNGLITVESTRGIGSRFEVELPFTLPH